MADAGVDVVTTLTAAHLWVLNQMPANRPAHLDDVIDVADETGLPIAQVIACVTDLMERGDLPASRDRRGTLILLAPAGAR